MLPGVDTLKVCLNLKHAIGKIWFWITEFNVLSNEYFASHGLSFQQQALYVSEYLGLFADKQIDAAQYFCVGWWESDYTPWDMQTGQPRPVFKAYQWWKDYAGESLPVTVEGIADCWAVACRNDKQRILYLPIHNQGQWQIRWETASTDQTVSVTAYFGDEVHSVKFASEQDGADLLIKFKWPQGSQAMLKIMLQSQ